MARGRWAPRFASGFLGLGLACVLAVGSAGAAPLAANDPSQALPAAPPSPSQDLTIHTGPATGGPEDTAPRLVLTQVEFVGAKTVKPSALAPSWADFTGKSVSLADLRTISRRAEAIYAKAGYPFVAVVLKVQEVKDGIVTFDVVEGHISDLTVLGSSRIARRQATANLAGLVDKSPLSLADVEGAYENTKNVPGLTMSGSLRRGSQPGGMDLVVATQRRVWRAYANVNNLYADQVGPWGVLVGVDAFGPTKYGDQLSAQVYSSVPFGRQVLVRGSYALRLNNLGTTVTVSGLWGHANPQGDLSALALTQDVASIRADVSQPIWMRANSKLQADLALEGSDQRANVFSKFRLSDDRLRDLSLTLSGEVRGRWGRFTANGEIHQDIEILGASKAGDADLSRFGGDPAATILRAGAEFESASFHHVRLDARVDSQYAFRPLTIPDQYAASTLR